jgi:hypothetical protein
MNDAAASPGLKRFRDLIIGLVLGGVLTLGVLLARRFLTTQTPISSFEECVHAGRPTVESSPRLCFANGTGYEEGKENKVEIK